MTTLILQVILSALGLGATIWAWWSKKNSDKQSKKDKLHADWKAAVDSGDPERISNMLTRMRAFDH